jgi:hypothetical protein
MTRWNVALAPGEVKTLEFAFTLEYPDNLDLPLVRAIEEQCRVK